MEFYLTVKAHVFVIIFFTCGQPSFLAGQAPLLQLSHKRFFVSEANVVFSEYEKTCKVRGWDVGSVDTNQEFLLLQDQVWAQLDNNDNAIWLVTHRIHGKVHWATEEIDLDLFWKGEPNLYGLQPPGGHYTECKGTSQECKPVQMTSNYLNIYNLRKPLLRDTCCWNTARVLCMADVDECLDQGHHRCPSNSQCVNTNYSFSCECLQGFVQQDNQCYDVDDCASDKSPVCPTHSVCSNTAGSYSCECQDGFWEDGDGVCQDVDECASSKSPVCPTHSVCSNTAGSYSCECQHGFWEDGDGVCQDVDECVNPAPGLCPHGKICVNSIGNFTCVQPGTHNTCKLCGSALCTSNFIGALASSKQ